MQVRPLMYFTSWWMDTHLDLGFPVICYRTEGPTLCFWFAQSSLIPEWQGRHQCGVASCSYTNNRSPQVFRSSLHLTFHNSCVGNMLFCLLRPTGPPCVGEFLLLCAVWGVRSFHLHHHLNLSTSPWSLSSTWRALSTHELDPFLQLQTILRSLNLPHSRRFWACSTTAFILRLLTLSTSLLFLSGRRCEISCRIKRSARARLLPSEWQTWDFPETVQSSWLLSCSVVKRRSECYLADSALASKGQRIEHSLPGDKVWPQLSWTVLVLPILLYQRTSFLVAHHQLSISN